MELSIDRVPRKTEKGSAIVEFAFVAPFLCLLLLGTVSVGMTLTRSLQAGVVSRDCGMMFMRQVDFTLEQNKRLAVKLASGMGMTTTGGDGAVVLTELLRIGADDCAAGGLSLAACSNFDQVVAVKRVTIGAGERAFASEAYFLTPEINLPGYRSNTYVYQRNIF